MDLIERLKIAVHERERRNILYNLLPLVSETEILHSEQVLGVSLPPLLKRFYTEVANGGVGPGNTGILHLPHSGIEHFEISLFHTGFLAICGWGCGISSLVWLKPPDYPVVRVDPNGYSAFDEVKDMPEIQQMIANGHFCLFDDHIDSGSIEFGTVEALSLEQWFTTWLEREDQFDLYVVDFDKYFPDENQSV